MEAASAAIYCLSAQLEPVWMNASARGLGASVADLPPVDGRALAVRNPRQFRRVAPPDRGLDRAAIRLTDGRSLDRPPRVSARPRPARREDLISAVAADR